MKYENKTEYTSIVSPHVNTLPSWMGMTISIIGNLLISTKLSISKDAHGIRLILMVLGEIGNFMAYGMAAVTIVVPLHSTVICLNLVIGIFFLKVSVRYRDTMGIIWTVIGVYVLVNFAKKEEVLFSADDIISNSKRPFFILCLSCVILIFLFALCCHLNVNSIGMTSMFIVVAAVGYVTSMSTKAVSSMFVLTLIGSNQLLYPVFYIMLMIAMVCAIGQSKLLNRIMDSFDTRMVVPVYFVVYTLSAISSGSIFYGEYYLLTPIEQIMRHIGTSLLLGGVFFITGGRHVDSKSKVEKRTSVVSETVESPINVEVQPVQAKNVSINSTAFSTKKTGLNALHAQRKSSTLINAGKIGKIT